MNYARESRLYAYLLTILLGVGILGTSLIILFT
jgi:hypothetical protein